MQSFVQKVADFSGRRAGSSSLYFGIRIDRFGADADVSEVPPAFRFLSEGWGGEDGEAWSDAGKTSAPKFRWTCLRIGKDLKIKRALNIPQKKYS